MLDHVDNFWSDGSVMAFPTCHANRWYYRRVSCRGWRTNKRLYYLIPVHCLCRLLSASGFTRLGEASLGCFSDVGQSFPVYFDTSISLISSYAPYPPGKTIFIVPAITFAVLGVGFILFGSRVRQITNR